MLRLFLILNNIHHLHIVHHHTTGFNHSPAFIINHITANQEDDSQPMALVVASLVILLRFDPNKKKSKSR